MKIKVWFYNKILNKVFQTYWGRRVIDYRTKFEKGDWLFHGELDIDIPAEVIKETEKAVYVSIPCDNPDNDTTKYFKTWIPKSVIVD